MIARSSWDSLRALFEAALERPPGERAAFLRERIDDPAIRAEVESLLAAHERAGGFLTDPALRSVGADESVVETLRFQPGTRLAAFVILEPLGMGGMGEVYRARDTRLDRFVAIKVLSPELDLAARGRERFEREARAISRLSHPHICTVHDLGTAQVDGREVPFLVLEFLDGETLASRLARGPLAIDEALRAAIDIADALAAAHGQGIVHRDLKPSNVMVTRSGVKLLDFGLAQLRIPQDSNDAPSPAPSETSLTRTGMVIGTLPYMSPEQIDGRKADARSDVFSFGSLLYEMLTGRQAFAADPNRSAAAQVLSHDPIPMTQLAPALPADVEKIVAHCLRKDPGRRYQAIADVKVALEDVREESRGATLQRTSRAGSRRRWGWMLLAVPTALVGVYFGWIPRGSPDSVPPARVVPITTLPGTEATPTLAPDGDHVAFAWSGPNQDNFDIYVQRIGSGSEQRRTFHPERDFSPAWSPDNQWIAFIRGGAPGPSKVMLVPPHGGQERSLGEIHIRQNNAIPPYLSWFPDSRALVVVHSPAPDKPDALFVMSIETREKEALSYPPAADVFDTAPAVSPDGRTVAFIRGHELNVIGIGDHYRASTPPQPLTQRALGNTASPAWTPDGKEIVYASAGALWRIQASGQSAAPVPLAGQDAFMPVLSRSSSTRSTRLVFARAAFDPNIWRLDLPATGAPASSAPVPSITSTRIDGSPQFSPDGKRVAFRSTRTGPSEIWIADPDGANSVPLTSMGGTSSGSPRWSLDGQRIAFDSNAEGQWEIYVVAASGGRPQRLTFEPGEDSIPSFSTDGRFIYFTSKRSGVFEIWKMPVSGGDAVQVTRNGGVVALESKDGHVYYTQAHHAPSSLWRMPASGDRPQKLLDGVSARAFQVLDRGIYYVERYGGDGRALWGLQSGFGFLRSEEQFRLQFFDFASEKSTFVADLPGPLAMGLAVSSDARTVLFTRVDSASSDLMMVENFR